MYSTFLLGIACTRFLTRRGETRVLWLLLFHICSIRPVSSLQLVDSTPVLTYPSRLQAPVFRWNRSTRNFVPKKESPQPKRVLRNHGGGRAAEANDSQAFMPEAVPMLGGVGSDRRGSGDRLHRQAVGRIQLK